MDKTLLNKCISGLNLNSGDLVGLYSFGSYSGLITFNDKLDDPQADSFDNGNLNSDTYPLYNLCDTKDVNTVSGSGYFDGATILQAGKDFPNEDWTIFIEYESDDFSGANANLGRTLFSTMSSPVDVSGFNIGLNGVNKPYIQYKDKDGINTISTLNSELGKRNILSFSRSSDNDIIEMAHHDFLYDYTKYKSVNTPNAVNDSGVDKIYSSGAFYIGDFFSGNSDYTGFSGYVNNLIIFNEYLSSGARDIIAKSIIGSDYSGKRFEKEVVYSTGVTGIPVLTTGVTGTGITGYETVSSGEIESKCGDDFSGYAQSGVSGELTGSFYTFTTGTTLISGIEYVEKPEEVTIDESRRLEFKRTALISLKPFDSGIDTSEIYCYTGIDEGLNKSVAPKLNLNAFDLNSGYTGQDFVFYRNGLFQRSGVLSGEKIVSGNFYVSGDRTLVPTGVINEDGELDHGIYDLIDGDILFTGYESGTGTWSFTGDYYGKDIYLNGKKLMLLHNYNEINVTTPTTVIVRSTLNATETGELAFVPKKTYDTRLPESSDSIQYNTGGFVTEIVWFNGQRQKRNKDYLIISENSLLNTGEFVRYNDNFSLYEGQENGVEY